MEKEKGLLGDSLDSCYVQSGSVGEGVMEFEVTGPTLVVASVNTFANQTRLEFGELIQEIDRSMHEFHEVVNSDPIVNLPKVEMEGSLVPFDTSVNEALQDSGLVVQWLNFSDQEPIVKDINFRVGSAGSVEAEGRGRRKSRPKGVADNGKRSTVVRG